TAAATEASLPQTSAFPLQCDIGNIRIKRFAMKLKSMKLKFTKIHGIGNDFVVIDAISQSVALNSDLLRQIADRHFGVGCDQILMVESSPSADADFRYRIFNADGGEVEQCGNGARCFVKYVHDKCLTHKSEIRVETASGIISLKLE